MTTEILYSALKLIVAFAIVELFLILVFISMKSILNRVSEYDTPISITVSAFIKGVIERVLIITGLILNFNSILIVFAALKIGTRIDPAQRNEVQNDFFLIGSLVSLLGAIATDVLWETDLLSLWPY